MTLIRRLRCRSWSRWVPHRHQGSVPIAAITFYMKGGLHPLRGLFTVAKAVT